MRKLISVFMILLALWCLPACTEDRELQSPITFYYPREKYTYWDIDSVIAWERRETAGYDSDPAALISLYLLGPMDSTLRSPFPAETRLISCQKEENALRVILSDEFAQLTALDLTLACTSLAATCMGITQLGVVHIQAETLTLDSESVITIRADNLALLDDVSTNSVVENEVAE